MKSGKSCLTTIILILGAVLLLRYALPGVWKILAGLFTGVAVVTGVSFLVLFLVIAVFTVRNLKKNKAREQEKQFAHFERTQSLYRSIMDRLQSHLELNQVSSEELLQSEILLGERLPELKKEMIRLKELVSSGSQRQLNDQLREYQSKLRQSTDAAAQEVFRENLKMLEEKRERMSAAAEEIRQKDAVIDLVFNALVRVEDDLKVGRPIAGLLPPEVYVRFGLEAPASQRPELPPLRDKSSSEE